MPSNFRPWTPDALVAWELQTARAMVEEVEQTADAPAPDPLALPAVEPDKLDGMEVLPYADRKSLDLWGQRFDRSESLPRIERKERAEASKRAKTMQERFAAHAGYLNKPREHGNARPMNARERSKLRRAARHHASKPYAK